MDAIRTQALNALYLIKQTNKENLTGLQATCQCQLQEYHLHFLTPEIAGDIQRHKRPTA